MSQDFPRRFEIGDLVILVYIAAFARQYLWPVSSNWLAWPLTALLSALVWSWHWRTKEPVPPRTPPFFWLAVVVPLFFFYALRAALPDQSWDVLDYRLMNGERALFGWPAQPGEFFPSRFPFNPAPDMVMGLGRHLLGYRLGTLINFSVLVWVGMILERILRTFITGERLRCFCVLVLLLTEHVLFEVNNYMVDLLALPLLLEAGRLAICAGPERQRQVFVRIGLYLGAALAFKLANLAFAIPIFVLLAYRIMSKHLLFDLKATLLCLGGFALPLLPYSLYMWWQTGSPVFPLYNSIFASPYWPQIDPRPERWAPIVDDPRFKDMKLWEILLWPLLQPFRVENTAGDLGPHWGRIGVAFLSALVCVFARRAHRLARAWGLIVVLGCIVWSAAVGMLRYATVFELVGGALALYLISVLWRPANDIARTSLQRTTAVLLGGVLLAQSASACVFGYRFEWGSRPAFFEAPQKHLPELRHLFSDRNARSYLPDRERALFDAVGAWVASGAMTPGMQLVLTPKVPQVCVYMPEFFVTEQARQEFARVLEAAKGKQIATLCRADDLKSCTEHIRRAGLGIGKIVAVSLPFFSNDARFATSYYMEILLPGEGGRREFSITAAAARLTNDDFQPAIAWAETPPARVKPGEQRSLRLLVKNAGRATWPALAQKDNYARILIGNHWLDRAGRTVVNDDGRCSIPYDLPPGDEVELLLTVKAPRAAGDYLLEIDTLQEGISWNGSDTLRVAITVQE